MRASGTPPPRWGPLRTLGNLRLALKTVLDGTDDSFVYYLEASFAKNRRGEERLVAEKLDVGAELASRWYPETKTVGYCSATLAVGQDFGHFEHAVGLDCLGPGASRSLTIPSSYDFDRNMAVVVASDLPDPYSRDYLPAMADALVAIHEAMGGSVLTLFTNRRDMEQLHSMVSPVCVRLAWSSCSRRGTPTFVACVRSSWETSCFHSSH